MPVETPSERRTRLGLTSDQVQPNPGRPQSACETANHTTSSASTVQSRSPPVAKMRLWTSTRTRSKSGLARLNSFFLLATRAYPNQKECERLVKELQGSLLFESFVRNEQPTVPQTMRDTVQVRRSHTMTPERDYNQEDFSYVAF
ncbi:unnamed protein product [Echinostoma caproni]|uniref:Uncharacterized protein n=1 Tax=Echinostoma caproni TaxID=27848 RepID=A0A183AP84_9TREM|nr:unnamed protein product [Echinostoma caproni]